jgi:alkanesulfonate monooxygenase SsuD/methylene tetrahydromethanopterin reductase-like flavin-dependent oxidoreductase (luciferase family)
MEFGLLLPHFGEHASRDAVLAGALKAERLGFDSVFVRDHLLFEPHGTMENADLTFFDALTTLTAVGAVTSTITLGTGALIPYRNPVHLARIVATMTSLVGDRVQLGIGAGRFGREFDLVKMTGSGGLPMVASYIRALRALGAEAGVSIHDEYIDFDDVTVEPQPARPVPIWYCGSSPASARFAVDECDGWMPGRITLPTIRVRRTAMAERADARGVTMPKIGVIAPTSIGSTRAEAVAGVNLDGLLRWANDMGTWWVKPASGRFETADDIEGSLVAGDPDEVTHQVLAFAESGVDQIVFDLRASFDRWDESLELLGTEVLPKLRATLPATLTGAGRT